MAAQSESSLSPSPSRTGNRLLDSIPDGEFRALEPHLERVSLSYAQPLIMPNEPIRNVYFPINSLGSLVTILEDGATVEAGSVGREGMIGVPVILDAATTPMQTVTQIPGDAYRIPSDIVKAAFDRGPALHRLLNRYVHTLFVIASQSAACNRRHTVEQRLARWLLMSSDGVGSDELALTQEFLATMLGVRRSGVTEAAVKLQDAGIIRYSRGFVEIVHRTGLEDEACECYGLVRREYGRVAG